MDTTMDFALYHFSDHPIILLDCPKSLDFCRGINISQRYIHEMFMGSTTPTTYWFIQLGDIGRHFDLFAKVLTQCTVYGDSVVYDSRVKTVIIAEPELKALIDEFFSKICFPSVNILTFNSVDEALNFCFENIQLSIA
jgi:hypothetical protein